MRHFFKAVIVAFAIAIANCDPPTQCPAPTDEQATKTSLALADFAINFYKNVSSTIRDKNAVMSPISVALALALLENGASGNTQNLIKNLLIQTGSNVEVLSAYRNIQNQLQIGDEKSKVTIANGIFPDNSLALKQEFITTTKDCYNVDVKKYDFHQLDQTRQKINQWVSEKTNTKIPELFKPGVLTPDTVLVLANAIYFKAAWKNVFLPGNTQNQTFNRLGSQENKQNVPFMRNNGAYGFAENEEVKILEMAYTHADLSMYVFLPKSVDGLQNFEQNLSGQKIQTLISTVQPGQVKVEMPKFIIRSPIDLKNILGSMGLGVIFTDQAEFGRMSEAALKVSKAVHEAYINVNENGTEAAAATGISMVPRSGPPKATSFIADHPFLYTIVHKPTKAILFLGKVNFVDEEEN